MTDGSIISARRQLTWTPVQLLAHPDAIQQYVGAIVRDQVLFGAASDRRISSAGPFVLLNPQAAVQLALVLHELGTNARKYGALSVPNGRLSLRWRVRNDDGDQLLFDWTESASAKVVVPSARGFGTTLIEETLRALGGGAAIHYYADGLRCEMRMPLPKDTRPHPELRSTKTHEPAESRVQQVPISQSLNGKRVLIVEDEPLLSIDLETTLTEVRCEVKGPAGTLKKAMGLIAKSDYDAALLDANLGGRPVDELAAALTQQNVPFAFVSGYGREALPQGFRHAMLLGKPFNKEQLRAVVQALIYRDAGVVQLRPRKMEPRGR